MNSSRGNVDRPDDLPSKQDERWTRLGRELPSHDALVTLVRLDGVLRLAERFERLDQHHVGILTVGIDGDQAPQGLERLTRGPMTDRPSGEGQRALPEMPTRRLLRDVEPVVELRCRRHRQPIQEIAAVERQRPGRAPRRGPSSDGAHAGLEERHVRGDRQRDDVPSGAETPRDGRWRRRPQVRQPAQRGERLLGLGEQEPRRVPP